MSLNTPQYEILADLIESVLRDPQGVTTQVKDENVRSRLVEGGRKLAICLEDSRATLRRVSYSVCNAFFLP